MTDVIDLGAFRQRKKDEAEGWETDEEMSVTIVHDPEAINWPIIRIETSDSVIEKQITDDEARQLAYRLLNLANTPPGIQLRGHAEGEDP